MIGELNRGRTTNYVKVVHAVIGAVMRWCHTCANDFDHAILEPGNLVMCSVCNRVSAK